MFCEYINSIYYIGIGRVIVGVKEVEVIVSEVYDVLLIEGIDIGVVKNIILIFVGVW